MNDPYTFLSSLKAQAEKSTAQFVFILIADANRLQEMNGEGAYAHREAHHGYQRAQLLSMIERLTRELPRLVAEKLSGH
jgi:hypothetical protein